MLAELFAADPDVCTWHLTEAALGPDEQVAAQVEAAADRVLQRGDAVAAVRALIRAAELSPEGPARARRLSGAAYVGASDVGALASSAALLRQARVADPSQEDSLSSAVAAAFLMVNSDGDIDTAHLLLVAALDAHPAGSADHVVEEALNTLSMLCFNSGRRDWWESLQAAVQRHSATLAPAFVLMAATVADPARVSGAVLEQIDQAVRTCPSTRTPFTCSACFSRPPSSTGSTAAARPCRGSSARAPETRSRCRLSARWSWSRSRSSRPAAGRTRDATPTAAWNWPTGSGTQCCAGPTGTCRPCWQQPVARTRRPRRSSPRWGSGPSPEAC